MKIIKLNVEMNYTKRKQPKMWVLIKTIDSVYSHAYG